MALRPKGEETDVRLYPANLRELTRFLSARSEEEGCGGIFPRRPGRSTPAMARVVARAPSYQRVALGFSQSCFWTWRKEALKSIASPRLLS